MAKFKEINVDLKLTPEMILKQMVKRAMAAKVNGQAKTDAKANAKTE